MTREETKVLLPVIQAFSEGRIIEFSSITDVSKAWREVTDFPIGMIKNFKFRIKPEVKYRPFKDAKECWAEMQKHQPFGWLKDFDGNYYQIISMGDIFIGTVNSSGKIISKTYYDFYFDCTFADGTTFGVKVEE